MSSKHHSKAAEAAIPDRHKKAVRNSLVNSVVCALRRAEERRELVKRSTVGLYCLKTKDSAFGVPYCAASDKLALLASKEILPLANVYQVGSYCLLDGKVSSCRPRLVLENKI